MLQKYLHRIYKKIINKKFSFFMSTDDFSISSTRTSFRAAEFNVCADTEREAKLRNENISTIDNGDNFKRW